MAAAPRNPWIAVDPAADRVAHARTLRRAHDAFVSGGSVPQGVRAVVAQSWMRTAAEGIDPDRNMAPIVVDEDEIAERWHAHPLFPVLPVLRDLLSGATNDAHHMLVISDADGVLLWLEGHHKVVAATEDMHFVCGADWSESGAGTNALGTALAVDHPVQIFSAEHFTRSVHPWQCSGAPIHDPATGEVLGVVDLTGHLRTAHPHTLALVTAAAGMAEAWLRQDALRRAAEPRTPAARDVAPAPARRPAVRLELLGDRPVAVQDGTVLELTRRHAELLAVLALAGRGLTPEELAHELYGPQGKAVTARAELSRLRRALGSVVETRPYRLAGRVELDVLEVERLLAAGRTADALTAHPEPLLPGSAVPAVVEARERVEGALRRAVVRSRDRVLLGRWLATPSGRDDRRAAELLLALLPQGHRDRPAAAARLARLRRMQGFGPRL